MKRIPRRSVYAATMVAILVMVTGFAIASITLGSFTSAPGQNGVTGGTSTITGVSFPLEQVSLAGAGNTLSSGCSAVDASVNTPASSHALAASGSPTTVVCTNTGGTTGSPVAYASGDFVQIVEVALTPASTPAAHYFKLDLFLGGAANTGTAHIGLPTNPVTAYVDSTISGWGTGSGTDTVELVFDMSSSGTTSITTVNVLVTDCGTTVC